MKSRISIIVPAYNRSEFLGSALQTISAQALPDIEVLLIDDGSTDNLESLARSYAGQVRYIYQQHLGPSAARNRGLREAGGEFIAFLDIDDLWEPRQLSRLRDALAAERG